MKEMFIGRQDELARLEKAWSSDKFEFVVIYGRRRVGKSFLIDAFIDGKKGVYFEAVDGGTELTQINLFSRSVSFGLYGTENLVYRDFLSIFDDIAKKAEKERIYLAIDEISYLCESCPEVVGLLQHYVDVVFKKTKLVLILSGSSRRFIEENILGRQSPLYGRRTEQIKLYPFSTHETAKMLSGWNIQDLAIAHIITGGIPYYLSFIKRHENAIKAIEDEFFKPGSSLFTEAELFMSGIYRKPSTYESILYSLAHGNCEVNKISGKTGISVANVSSSLASLASQGIVAKRDKIEGHGIGRGWEIIDGYFAFYYQFIYPYHSLIERGRGKAAFYNVLDALDLFISKRIEFSFREYVLTNSGLLISSIGSIDFPNPIKKRNEEIDLFGKSNKGWIVGECKWQKSVVDIEVLKLLEKRKLLLIEDDNADYFLLSKSGFSDDIKAIAKERCDIHLITGEDLFKQQ